MEGKSIEELLANHSVVDALREVIGPNANLLMPTSP